tara:strand:- start:8915 stop:9634 length:720 start_codon:yes stop_codon:yes gene_type:complete
MASKLKGNIIVQHWSGPKHEWVRWAEKSVRKYCKTIGCEYELLTDFPLGDIVEQKKEKPYQVIQKLSVLGERFDKYEQLLLLDMDMVATPVAENVFNHKGIGRLHLVGMEQANASKNGRKWPNLYHEDYPMFFGNFIKLNRQQRRTLHAALVNNKEEIINKNFSEDGLPPNDEIILHHLFYLTGAFRYASDHNDIQVPHMRFCDLPEESHPNATFLHFCNSRKNQIPDVVRKLYGLSLL